MADAVKITTKLLKRYPHPQLALRFSTPLELLVATILSAQSTDVRVNRVTKDLFRKYRTARDYARADPAVLQEEIRPSGFYRNKTKMLIACGQALVTRFGGKVPDTMEALTTLPGVGRKTAAVVLGNAFGQQAIAVDTHVLRVSNRLGLAHSKDPAEVEEALRQQVPHGKWTVFTRAMILHGRETCTARRPRCCACPVYAECEWPQKLDCGPPT